jgi:dihydroneopterin aldolase
MDTAFSSESYHYFKEWEQRLRQPVVIHAHLEFSAIVSGDETQLGHRA